MPPLQVRGDFGLAPPDLFLGVTLSITKGLPEHRAGRTPRRKGVRWSLICGQAWILDQILGRIRLGFL